MFVLMKMGHGDEIVLADGNFPADSNAQRIVRADGNGIKELLDAILLFLPLDTFVPDPAFVMEPVDQSTPEPRIWADYRRIMNHHENRGEDDEGSSDVRRTVGLEPVERFAFYEQARSAYAIVATSESSLYANLILKKGVVQAVVD